MGRAKPLAATTEEEVLGSDSRPLVGVLQRELPRRIRRSARGAHQPASEARITQKLLATYFERAAKPRRDPPRPDGDD